MNRKDENQFKLGFRQEENEDYMKQLIKSTENES